MIGCDRLVEFADGELLPVQADQFRDHLASCRQCQDKLQEYLQWEARLTTLTPSQQDELATKIRHGIVSFEDK